ncbi:TPM domain-containing protein [Phenylobacterium sp.]|uniref:TPM domain-containing protein n=1 Tax=Phenylobacterium sp. TaxID=1871053 RepID=UPI002D7765C5|nr:TPM domain-containing protein [Phenylobacterium sp.]
MLATVVALFAFASVAFAAVPKFPPLTGRVVDDAHMLSPATTEKLTSDLANLEAKTGHQVVVATVPDLQGFEIEDYGYQLGRTWQLGRKGVNDGAILLVAPKEHKVRIEVGYGLEPVLTDALTSVILQEKVLPQFKAGHMEQGVVDGTEAVIAQVALPDDQAKANAAQAVEQPRPQVSGSGAVRHRVPVLFIFLIVFWVISGLMRAGGRRGMGGLWWLPFLFMGGGRGGGWGGGGGFGGGGGGGFSGGGGSFGGGGSSGSW